MAKKKKHNKKLRNSRKRRLAQSQTPMSASSVTREDAEVVTKITTKAEKTTQVSAKNAATYDDVELGYVKSDVAHTLTLVAIILALYALLWILMTYTSVGSQLTKLFMH